MVRQYAGFLEHHGPWTHVGCRHHVYAHDERGRFSVPSTTYAILSAFMQPAVPYYIIINSLMELLIVPFAVFLNWDATPKRRTFVIIGVVLYFVILVWTYLVYAETRLEISEQALTAADMEWFKWTLVTDYRVVLELISQGFFVLAAFVSASPFAGRIER